MIHDFIKGLKDGLGPQGSYLVWWCISIIGIASMVLVDYFK